jgi:hypothetical protein
MLVTTNDAFYGLNSVTPSLLLPFSGTGTRGNYFSPAYDAGTEFNSEDCQYIPGPPCGNGGVHDPSAAEGFVHIHPGIYGGADLDPKALDWRNPVAKITIRLIDQQ